MSQMTLEWLMGPDIDILSGINAEDVSTVPHTRGEVHHLSHLPKSKDEENEISTNISVPDIG